MVWTGLLVGSVVVALVVVTQIEKARAIRDTSL